MTLQDKDSSLEKPSSEDKLQDQIIRYVCEIGKKNWSLKRKESEVEDLKKKISSLEKEFELKDSQIDNLKNSINEIHQSFTWKMLRKYDQIKGKNIE